MNITNHVYVNKEFSRYQMRHKKLYQSIFGNPIKKINFETEYKKMYQDFQNDSIFSISKHLNRLGQFFTQVLCRVISFCPFLIGSIPSRTQLKIVNTFRFSGQWKPEFRETYQDKVDTSALKNEHYHPSKGTRFNRVSMMKNKGPYYHGYSKKLNADIISISYEVRVWA